MKNYIFIATIVFIIGIIMGLYLKMSIVFLLCFILAGITITFYLMNNSIYTKIIGKNLNINSNKQNLKSIKQLFYRKRLNKVNETLKKKISGVSNKFYSLKLNNRNSRFLNVKLIVILILILLLSALYSNYKNNLFDEKYKNLISVETLGKVINLENESEYNITYRVRVKKINNLSKYNGTDILLKVKKTNKTNIDLGDIIYFEGTIKEPDVRKNYNGFDYKRYLNSKNIYTVINCYTVNVIKENERFNVYSIKEHIINRAQKVTSNTNASICLALILGYKVNIPEDINEHFESSNLLHLLAISGMHVSFISIILNFMLKKFSKKNSKILIIIFLAFYIIVTGANPSVMRACIMQIMALVASLVYKKSNLITNMSISVLIILIINPITIFNIGFLFSYMGTISIIIFNKYIEKGFDFFEIKFTSLLRSKLPSQKNIFSKIFSKLYSTSRSILIVTISANILLIPISMYFFNSFSCVFIISNLLVQPIFPVIICISIIQIVSSSISVNLGHFVCFFSDIFISVFLKITEICAKLPFSKILTTTPSIVSLLIFYFSISMLVFLEKKGRLNKYNFVKFIKKAKNMLKKPAISFLIIILIINLIYFKSFPKDLEIFFIDVGQGDSTLIITPNNKKILIDGGGSEIASFDVGEKTLLPYLLSRKIKSLDYIFISHFDSDHVRWNLVFTKRNKSKKYNNRKTV